MRRITARCPQCGCNDAWEDTNINGNLSRACEKCGHQWEKGAKPMETTPAKIEENPNQLIALALERQADPGILEKLMNLQEKWEERQARKAYVVAMSAFKQEAPAVLKKADVVDFSTAKGRTRYNYANLGSIVQAITVVLGKHQLSASWSTTQENNNVTVACHITHVAGHRESVTLTGPIDESGNKNRIQAVGSTVTYLQRYTLLAALGLATGEDDDGRQGASSGNPPMSEPKPKEKKGADKQGDEPGEVKTISEAQRKRFFAIYKNAGKEDDAVKEYLKRVANIEHTTDIPIDRYDEFCEWAAEENREPGADDE